MKKLFATGMIALSLLFGASRLEASSVEKDRALNSQIEKKQDQQELSARQKQLDQAIKKAMVEVQRQQVEKIAKNHYMPANPSAAYDGKSVAISKSRELKTEEGLVTKLGASFLVDENRRAKAVNFTGEHEKARVGFSYDLQSRHSTLQSSYKAKNNGIEVVIRDFKEPVVKAYASPVKGFIIGVHADPKKHYYSTSLGASYQGVKVGINQESIYSHSRTTTSLSYSLPKDYNTFVKSISWAHVAYQGRHSNSFQASGKIGYFDVHLGLDNMIMPDKYNPSARVSMKMKF